MPFVAIGEMGAIRGTLWFPRIGVWHADLDLQADDAPTGPVTVAIGASTMLRATVHSGGYVDGMARLRVVGGADGLAKTAKPKHYTRPTFRTVLNDLAASVGEKVSPASSVAVVGGSLPNWTTLGLTVGEMVSTLVTRAAPAGTAWRILTDGSLWVGPETWPDSPVGEDYRELNRNERDRRLELGLDAPLVMPGTVLGGERIDYAEYTFGMDHFAARVWTVPA